MPSWKPWSPRSPLRSESPRLSNDSGASLSPAQMPPTPTSSKLAPWVDPESEEDDEVVNAIIKSTNERTREKAQAHRQARLKSATRSKTLRRPVPSFDDFANSIPEEAAPEYEGPTQDHKTSQEKQFPGNPEDFKSIEEIQNSMPPAIPPARRSSKRHSRSSLSIPRSSFDHKIDQNINQKVESDLPLLNRSSDEFDELPVRMPSEKPVPAREESKDDEVIRLRKMCDVLQEKIIQLSQHTPPPAMQTTPSKRSSLIVGDRLAKTKLKDIPTEELASEGHRVAQVMRVMNEQLQKKLELRERLLFERNAHISQLERTHASQIEEFHASTKTDIQKMVVAYQKEISEMHQRNLLQITNLRNELEGKMNVKDLHNKEENTKLQNEIDTLKQKEADVIASHERHSQEREDLFRKDMAALRESITVTENELQKNYDAKLENLRIEHEKEIAELKKTIITRPLDLDSGVDKDIFEAKMADLESTLSQHIEELAMERERALELQIALDASEFSRQTQTEKLEVALKDEVTKREDFQKHEQRIRAQLLAASDEKRKECLKNERARYERLVREENVRRKAASDRYETELKELKQKNAEQVELFRMQKESIFELHERDVLEMEKRISAERDKVAEYESLLETVKSSREEDKKRFEREKADLVESHEKEKESLLQERRVLVATQARDKKLANAEKEALELDLKRMSDNCEELLHRRVRDSICSSRRSIAISESVASIEEEIEDADDTEKRIASEVAKVAAYSESQQKASTEAYERQTAVLKAELQALQKLQTRINAQVAEDERKISDLSMELDFKKEELERQAGTIADLELQLESEKGKFKDALERNAVLEKNLWEQKEANNETTKEFQNQIKNLNEQKLTLLATIASAGAEGEEAAGQQLKEEISLGYQTELQELESRHKEVIQTNINALFKLENLVRHFINVSGDQPPRSPSFIGTPRSPSFLGEVSTPVTDITPSLVTTRTLSSNGSIRSMPLHEPSFEPIFEPTFEPAFIKEDSVAESDYIKALKKAEAVYNSKPSDDRNELLVDIQNQIRSFKIQQLSFPTTTVTEAN